MALGIPLMRPQLNSQKMVQLNISAMRISPSQCRKMTEITMYVVRKNSLALPHCDENDCKQYFFHSQHFQSLSFSTVKRSKSEKKTVKINQKGDILAGLSLSDLAKSLKAHE